MHNDLKTHTRTHNAHYSGPTADPQIQSGAQPLMTLQVATSARSSAAETTLHRSVRSSGNDTSGRSLSILEALSPPLPPALYISSFKYIHR